MKQYLVNRDTTVLKKAETVKRFLREKSFTFLLANIVLVIKLRCFLSF